MEEVKKNPFFSLEDFSSYEWSIEGMNVTSQVRIPGGNHLIQIIEILDEGIWVELPPRSCADGHTLSFDISVANHKIFILGVVDQLDLTPSSRQQARVKFRQYSRPEWENLLNYFSKKQDHVNEFIQRTRK